MTGTGSSVFATFESLVGAEKVLEALPANVSGFIAGGLNFLNLDVK
jgi:4-diphosphocytidyl-2C-methyl-D-erythritol kinase